MSYVAENTENFHLRLSPYRYYSISIQDGTVRRRDNETSCDSLQISSLRLAADVHDCQCCPETDTSYERVRACLPRGLINFKTLSLISWLFAWHDLESSSFYAPVWRKTILLLGSLLFRASSLPIAFGRHNAVPMCLSALPRAGCSKNASRGRYFAIGASARPRSVCRRNRALFAVRVLSFSIFDAKFFYSWSFLATSYCTDLMKEV